MDVLDQEQRNVNIIQDPPSMRSCRTYKRGGKRLSTGAKIADKELRDQQKLAEKETRAVNQQVKRRGVYQGQVIKPRKKRTRMK